MITAKVDAIDFLPAAFAITMGVLVGAVQRANSLAGSLAFAGVCPGAPTRRPVEEARSGARLHAR
jgi:hypothetical protein